MTQRQNAAAASARDEMRGAIRKINATIMLDKGLSGDVVKAVKDAAIGFLGIDAVKGDQLTVQQISMGGATGAWLTPSNIFGALGIVVALLFVLGVTVFLFGPFNQAASQIAVGLSRGSSSQYASRAEGGSGGQGQTVDFKALAEIVNESAQSRYNELNSLIGGLTAVLKENGKVDVEGVAVGLKAIADAMRDTNKTFYPQFTAGIMAMATAIKERPSAGFAAPAAVTALPSATSMPIAEPAAAKLEKKQSFDFVNEETIDALLHVLANESPSAVSAVINFVPPMYAAQLLAAMPQERQKEVIIALSNVRELDA
jgi:hypothetical protein